MDDSPFRRFAAVGPRLRERQRTVAALYAAGLTAAAVARELGVPRKTIWRWQQLPHWNEEVEQVITAKSG